MKGAKGVIISITGGEDMRLMEVDEAANHIKDLVDPDANIIWGSAFNNDLEGKIRVSVVATGIDVEEATQAPPLQAKVFTFPGARSSEPPKAETEEEDGSEPMTLTPPEPARDGLQMPAEEERVSFIDEPTEAPSELALDHPADEDDEGDELLLDTLDQPEPPLEETEEAEAPAGGRRTWLTRDEESASAKPAREGGTLFERMSNIARGAAKAQVDEEPEAPRMRARDPLDIPRFLNRQNNQ